MGIFKFLRKARGRRARAPRPPRIPGPPVMTAGESRARVRELRAHHCHPEVVTLPDGTRVVLADTRCVGKRWR